MCALVHFSAKNFKQKQVLVFWFVDIKIHIWAYNLSSLAMGLASQLQFPLITHFLTGRILILHYGV